MQRNLNKQAFILGKGLGGAIFGSASHSLASNVAKNAGMSSLIASPVTPGVKPMGISRGFKVTRNTLPKQGGLSSLLKIKTPSIKSLGGGMSSYKGFAPKSVTSALSPKTESVSKSILSKTSARWSKWSKPKTTKTPKTPKTPRTPRTPRTSPSLAPKKFKGFKNMGLLIGAGAALKGIDKLYDEGFKVKDKRGFADTISYAVKENPELKKVPPEKLNDWMHAFYTLSPKMAKNKVLASTMLTTTHNYGGNIDLATAKTIAETGHRAEHKKSKLSEGINPATGFFLGQE